MKKLIILVLTLIMVLGITGAAISLSQGKKISDLITDVNSIPNGNDIVLTVGENNISRSEFLAAVEMQKLNITNLTKEQAKIRDAQFPAKDKDKALEKINKKIKVGPNILAASYLIGNYTLLDEAKKQGLLVEFDKAKEYANGIRNQLEKSGEVLDETMAEFLANIGEKTYWNEYAPKKYQMHLTIGKLKEKVMSSADNATNQQLWQDYETSLVIKSDFVIKDPTINISKQEVLDYINNYYN